MRDPRPLLRPTPKGLFSEIGGFFIDPVTPVAKALITHGHADHARSGHGAVMATDQTLDIMALRFGDDFCQSRQSAVYGAPLEINGVTVAFFPAGHVLGSAQIRLEHAGLTAVVSGDYKRAPDATVADFVPVPCDIFVTEATFALPVFTHPDPHEEIGKLLTSLTQFPERTHMVGAYALGKAQRVISLIRQTGYERPIYVHGALEKLCAYYESQGVALGPLAPATTNDKSDKRAGEIVLGPPSAFADRWARRFADPLTAFASGWMLVRQRARQRGVELPLVISDHCDWPELCETITEIAPQEVWVTHGREEALVRWCTLNGIAAKPLHLAGYEDEAD